MDNHVKERSCTGINIEWKLQLRSNRVIVQMASVFCCMMPEPRRREP